MTAIENNNKYVTKNNSNNSSYTMAEQFLFSPQQTTLLAMTAKNINKMTATTAFTWLQAIHDDSKDGTKTQQQKQPLNYFHHNKQQLLSSWLQAIDNDSDNRTKQNSNNSVCTMVSNSYFHHNKQHFLQQWQQRISTKQQQQHCLFNCKGFTMAAKTEPKHNRKNILCTISMKTNNKKLFSSWWQIIDDDSNDSTKQNNNNNNNICTMATD